MSGPKMVTRDVKIKFKNGNRSLATCDEDDVAIIKANPEWPNLLRGFTGAGNKQAVAFIVAAHSVHQAWRWVTISDVEEDNVLELQYKKTKEANFNTEVFPKMKDEVAANFKDLDDVLDEMLEEGDAECKTKIGQILKNVTVDSVEMVGEMKESVAAARIFENVKRVRDTDENITTTVCSTGQPGTVADTIYRNTEYVVATRKGGSVTVGGTSKIGNGGSACGAKKTVCARYLENTKNAQIHETGVQNRVVGSEGTETSLTKVKGGSGITVKKKNVCEEIKGEGSNNTTAGSIVEGTQTFTEIREGGKTHVDGTNAGGDSVTAGVVTRTGTNAVLKLKNHSMTING